MNVQKLFLHPFRGIRAGNVKSSGSSWVVGWAGLTARTTGRTVVSPCIHAQIYYYLHYTGLVHDTYMTSRYLPTVTVWKTPLSYQKQHTFPSTEPSVSKLARNLFMMSSAVSSPLMYLMTQNKSSSTQILLPCELQGIIYSLTGWIGAWPASTPLFLFFRTGVLVYTGVTASGPPLMASDVALIQI